MTNYSVPITSLSRTDMYGNEITLSIKGHPGNYRESDDLVAAMSEMIAPAIASHAFPSVTREDVADMLVPYSSDWQELRDVQGQLQTAVESMKASVHKQNEEDAYREYALREYLDELKLPASVHKKILLLLTTKQQDPVPPAA